VHCACSMCTCAHVCNAMCNMHREHVLVCVRISLGARELSSRYSRLEIGDSVEAILDRSQSISSVCPQNIAVCWRDSRYRSCERARRLSEERDARMESLE